MIAQLNVRGDRLYTGMHSLFMTRSPLTPIPQAKTKRLHSVGSISRSDTILYRLSLRKVLVIGDLRYQVERQHEGHLPSTSPLFARMVQWLSMPPSGVFKEGGGPGFDPLCEF